MSPRQVLAGLLIGLLTSCGGGSDGGTGPAPPVAASLLLTSGGGQHARITRPLPAPIIVRATTTTGTPVAGAAVAFSASGGSAAPASATTDASGQASTTWTLGPSAGIQTLTARLSSGGGVALTVTATADPAVAVTLTVLDGDGQQAVAGSATLVPPVVTARELAGAPAAGIRLRFEVRSGGGHVAGELATTDSMGRAAVGSWVLGSTLGTQELGVTAADLDVALTAPLAFSATAVPAGGFVTYPVRHYLLASTAPATVVDTATGCRFVFPEGAHGILDVARVADGPTLPDEGGVRFQAHFGGVEPVQVAFAQPSGGAVDAFFYGQLFNVAGSGDSIRWWGVAPREVRGDTVVFTLPTEPPVASATARGRAAPADPRRIKIQSYGAVVLPASYARNDVRARLQLYTTQTLDWWEQNLPTDALARKLRQGRRAFPLDVIFGTKGKSYYTRDPFGTATIYYNVTNQEASTGRHEPSHFATNLLVGEDRYQELAGYVPHGDHDLSLIAHGFRESLIEEYSHFADFVINGHLTGYDLRSLESANSVAELFNVNHISPRMLDYPSLEGFGAVMLAAVTRMPPDDEIWDFSARGSRTRAPALALPMGDLLGVLAAGPRTPNELRNSLTLLVGEPALSAVLEPVGWSYAAVGKVVDATTGEPLENVRIQTEITAGGTLYVRDAEALTDGDGRFELKRVFPGHQVFRLSRDGPAGRAEREVQITVPWSRATTDLIEFLEGKDGPIRVDFSVASRNYFWSDTYLAFTLPGHNEVRAEAYLSAAAPDGSIIRSTFTPGGYVPQYIEFARLPAGALVQTQVQLDVSLAYASSVWRAAEGADMVEYELETTGCRATWKPTSGAELVVSEGCDMSRLFAPGSEGGTLRIYATYEYKRTVLDADLRPTSQVTSFKGSHSVLEVYVL